MAAQQARSLQKKRNVLERKRRRLDAELDRLVQSHNAVWRSTGLPPRPLRPADFELALLIHTMLAHQGGLVEANLERLEPYGLTPKILEFGEPWRENGFARLNLGHKLSAALMMTSVGDIEVKAPWDAWSLQVPPELLPFRLNLEAVEKAKVKKGSDGSIDLAPAITSSSDDETYGYYGSILCKGSDPEWLLVQMKARNGNPGFSMPLNIQVDAGAEGVSALVRNLVKGVCLTIADAQKHRTGTWSGRQGKKRGTKAGPYAGCQYTLGTPVSIDLRDAVKQVALGRKPGGGSPSVQFLVRGHWRNQAHGPGLKQRRATWIEPFWKGHEEARALLKVHNLGT